MAGTTKWWNAKAHSTLYLLSLLYAPVAAQAAGGTPIEHIVIIMQEQRSFDHYFGTYPGADGIPRRGGIPTVCVPDPKTGNCVKPYHNTNLVNTGGPVVDASEQSDADGGLMDGFIGTAENPAPAWPGGGCGDPSVSGCTIDVMGYHDSHEIANYWSYARHFVLQDHFYGSSTSYGLPGHLYMLSGWSAVCAQHDVPSSCIGSNVPPRSGTILDAWTDITYLLHKAGVSWRYYNYQDPNLPGNSCGIGLANTYTPSEWNPLPCFDTVADDGELGNIIDISHFYADAASGTLPAVSWVAPNYAVSEHQRYSIADGENYVTGLINAVMHGPAWRSTAIFLTWANWGGYYDHEKPITVDGGGYGLRVPGLVISPYAKPGFIDHQVLSFDAYLKFIEDIFLGGARLDPATDGRPDPRPDVRENQPVLGDLMQDFNFSAPARAPLLLPVRK